ncbi:PAS domain-containing protein, partial [Brevundimonas sp. SPF441]|uniref:PAS domain-containing protein n=1 Tax=Brevundimonas sp. SPF441 TaxID=2663795 RepID=UPI001416AEB5|nr:chemotaxis protein [Brevundimonas sp. SPF441]
MRVFGKPQDDRKLVELQSMLAAVDRSQAVIQFDLDGTVRDANRNFLSVIGYELGEIFGRHHR